jgi:hypothetical protein
MNPYAIWFRRVVILGILLDWFLGLPGIFIPNAVLAWARAAPSVDPVWPAFASLIVVLLSLFYIPAAADPYYYKPLAVLTVLARVAEAGFFFVLYPGVFPPAFGYIELILGVLQGALLVLALRAGPVAQPH